MKTGALALVALVASAGVHAADPVAKPNEAAPAAVKPSEAQLRGATQGAAGKEFLPFELGFGFPGWGWGAGCLGYWNRPVMKALDLFGADCVVCVNAHAHVQVLERVICIQDALHIDPSCCDPTPS